ncbi:hypothetical protein [Lysinibacillus pakistanensis]|uniref:hypothetical protein n=1 Tax=Lysinibacillus pakistanensis TaxID=759811 RepID=UPI003D2D2F8D
MDFERPTRIVANNLREFLRVNMTDSELFYNQFESEVDYFSIKKRWSEEEGTFQLSENDKLVQENVTKLLIENLEDGLGVIAPLLKGEKQTLFQIQKHIEPNLELLKNYLYSAPVASKLALFRDIQLNFVMQEHLELLETVVEAMNNMGLTDEANRLSEDI